MKSKVIFILITMGISALHAKGQIQISAEYSTFIIKENFPGILTDSLVFSGEKIN